MFWNDLSIDEKNKTILQLLVHLCKADSNFQNEEFDYLIYFCKNTGLDPELIRFYLMNDSYPRESLPQDEQERMNILYHLLFTINADSLIGTDEEIAVYKLAFILGFHENITKDFIEIMKIYPITKLPKDAMVSIIRKYSN